MDRRRFLASSGSALPLAVAGCSDYLGDNSISVTDWNELHEIRENTDGAYRLTADLDAGTDGYDNHIRGDNGWQPIGAQPNAPQESFRGTFDGNGHTISDLVIDRPDATGVGLFRRITGKVTNLALANCDIVGGRKTGALVGTSTDGTIAGVSVSGSVNGTEKVGGITGSSEDTTLKQVAAGVSVSGNVDVGGVIGANEVEADLTEATATGRVDGERSVGGLTGWNSGFGDVVASSGLAAVTGNENVGGLVGHNEQGGVLEHSFTSSEVDGRSVAGALVGLNDGTIIESYWNRNTTTPNVGDGENGGTALEAQQMQGETATTAMEALDFESTWTVMTDPPEYPVHAWQ